MQPLQVTLRFTLFGILVFVSFCLLSVVWAACVNNGAQIASATSAQGSYSSSMAASPDAVSRVMAETYNWTNDRMIGMQQAVYTAPRAAAMALTGSGRFITRSVGDVIQMPGHVVRSVGHISVAGIIQPSRAAALPTITSFAPVAVTTPAAAVLPPALPTPPATEVPMWPIHGRITTLFGVPEPPYEPIHTGIDISDGRPAGTTPIHTFRSGRVIEAVHSSVKLGNHVVIDHGGGLTSVYGHLASISVSPGQTVDQSTVLGYEGSTGVSTGTHLHFEIRQNDRPVNPELYISGLP